MPCWGLGLAAGRLGDGAQLGVSVPSCDPCALSSGGRLTSGRSGCGVHAWRFGSLFGLCVRFGAYRSRGREFERRRVDFRRTRAFGSPARALVGVVFVARVLGAAASSLGPRQPVPQVPLLAGALRGGRVRAARVGQAWRQVHWWLCVDFGPRAIGLLVRTAWVHWGQVHRRPPSSGLTLLAVCAYCSGSRRSRGIGALGTRCGSPSSVVGILVGSLCWPCWVGSVL